MQGGSSTSSMPRSISIDGFMVPVTTKRSVSAPKGEVVPRPLPQLARARRVSDSSIISHSYSTSNETYVPEPLEEQTIRQQLVALSVPSDSSKNNEKVSTTSKANLLLLCYVLVFAGITLIMGTWGLELKSWYLTVYAAIVIALRAPSAAVYGCAFFTLFMVPVSETMNKTLLSESYAVYSYLLLVLGTFIAISELRKEEPAKGFDW